MKRIKESIITPVSVWNTDKTAKGQYILVYTLGDGSMLDTPRQKGYVVQKRHVKGGEGSRFFLNKEKAEEYQLLDKL